MKNKMNIFLIIFLTILLLIAVLAVGYLFKTNKSLNLDNDNLKAKLQEFESKEELEKNDETVEPIEFKNAKYDESLYTDEKGAHIYPFEQDGEMSITLKGNNELYINLYGDLFKSYKGEYKVEGINGQIVEAKLVLLGNGMYSTVLILMEDGTVEYVKPQNYSVGKAVSSGKIEGLENVVRIVEVAHTGLGAGFSSAAAIKNDGTTQLIDISTLIF